MHRHIDAPKDSLSCGGVCRAPPAFSLECLVFHAQVNHPIVTSMQSPAWANRRVVLVDSLHSEPSFVP